MFPCLILPAYTRGHRRNERVCMDYNKDRMNLQRGGSMRSLLPNPGPAKMEKPPGTAPEAFYRCEFGLGLK